MLPHRAGAEVCFQECVPAFGDNGRREEDETDAHWETFVGSFRVVDLSSSSHCVSQTDVTKVTFEMIFPDLSCPVKPVIATSGDSEYSFESLVYDTECQNADSIILKLFPSHYSHDVMTQQRPARCVSWLSCYMYVVQSLLSCLLYF